MSSRKLCQLCLQLSSKSISSRNLKNDCESLNEPNPHQSNGNSYVKCSGCGKVFSPVVQDNKDLACKSNVPKTESSEYFGVTFAYGNVNEEEISFQNLAGSSEFQRKNTSDYDLNFLKTCVTSETGSFQSNNSNYGLDLGLSPAVEEDETVYIDGECCISMDNDQTMSFDSNHESIAIEELNSTLVSTCDDQDFIDNISSSMQDIESPSIKSSAKKSFRSKDPSVTRNGNKFYTWTHPIYWAETKQKVNADEIDAKVGNCYKIDKSQKQPFICQIDHECPKFFTNKWNVQNHIFSHYFYTNCPNCGRVFNFLFSIDRHLRICKEKDLESGFIPPSGEKMLNKELISTKYRKYVKPKPITESWIHPIYSLETNQRVFLNEIQAKIKSNYVIDKSQKQPYICSIDHDCYRDFINSGNVENHIFGHFFYVPCPNCGHKYKLYYKMNLHLEKCEKLVELANLNLGDNEGGKNFSTWIHPVYSLDSHQVVCPNEISAKIRCNYNFDKKQTRPFICKIAHECRGSFLSSWNIIYHIFSSFFFVPCPNCGKDFAWYNRMTGHLKKCGGESQVEKSTKRSLDTSNNIIEPFKEYANKKRKISTDSLFDGPQQIAHLDKDAHARRNHFDFENSMTEKQSYLSLNSKPREFQPIESTETMESIFNQLQSSLTKRMVASSFYENEDIEIISKIRAVDDQSIFQEKAYVQPEETENEKVVKKFPRGPNVYRCPFCEFKCKPGRRHRTVDHLNGRIEKGKFIPPTCYKRRQLKPADPETGLYEKLEPIAVNIKPKK